MAKFQRLGYLCPSCSDPSIHGCDALDAFPNTEAYGAMPDMLKPRPIQYLVPQHIAVDFLPLPPLRETLIKNFRD